MTSDTMRGARIIALALLVATVLVAQEILSDLAGGKRVSVMHDVVFLLIYWVVWAFLTPAVVLALRRWPLDVRPGYRPILIHGAVAIGLSVAHGAITIGLRSATVWLGLGLGFQKALRVNAYPSTIVWGLFTGPFFYAIALMIYTMMRLRSLYVAKQLSEAALEAELTRSKLESLRSQLRPHFLFNTLNAISVFVVEDADKAQQMLLRLSTLLRRSLDEDAQEVALSQELGFVNDYLDIQRGRYGDELIVRVAVDPAVMDARVPVFLLQPLLENAIEHGKSDGKCTTISLSASREDGMLRVALEDDGPGVGSDAPVREGIGLSNTRARLLHLYGPRATVALRTVSPGARVEIRIPFATMSG